MYIQRSQAGLLVMINKNKNIDQLNYQKLKTTKICPTYSKSANHSRFNEKELIRLDYILKILWSIKETVFIIIRIKKDKKSYAIDKSTKIQATLYINGSAKAVSKAFNLKLLFGFIQCRIEKMLTYLKL